MARPRKAYVQTLTDAQGKVRGYKVRWTFGTPQSQTFGKTEHTWALALRDVLNDPQHGCNLSADDERVSSGTIYGRTVQAVQVRPRTVQEVALEAIAGRRAASEQTRAQYRQDLRTHLRTFLTRDIATLTTRELQAWVDEMRHARTGEPLKATAKVKRQQVLRMTLRYALAQGYITRDPLASVQRWGDADVLGDTAQRVLLNDYGSAGWVRDVVAQAAAPVYADLWLFMAWTGLRIGEATGLQVKHVRLDAAKGAHVQVRQQAKRGRKIGPPKTRSSVRDAYVFGEPHALLQRLTEGRDGEAFVFACPHQPGLPMAYNTVHARWEEARAKTRHTDMTMHDLRHHFATYGLAHGLSIYEVQGQLGHATHDTTSRIYVHADPATGVSIRAKMAGWGQPQPADEVAAKRRKRRTA